MEYIILYTPLVFWGVLGLFSIGVFIWWWIYEKDI